MYNCKLYIVVSMYSIFYSIPLAVVHGCWARCIAYLDSHFATIKPYNLLQRYCGLCPNSSDTLQMGSQTEFISAAVKIFLEKPKILDKRWHDYGR